MLPVSQAGHWKMAAKGIALVYERFTRPLLYRKKSFIEASRRRDWVEKGLDHIYEPRHGSKLFERTVTQKGGSYDN